MTGVGTDAPRDFREFVVDTRRRIVSLERRQGGGGAAYSKGTTAQRNITYPLPSTDAGRVSLANSMPIWFNTEKGWEESYYATTGLSGLSVRGLLAGHPSGWYPLSAGPFISVRRPTDQSVAAGVETIITYSALESSQNWPVVIPAQKMRAPIGGKYEIAAAATASQVGGNYFNLYLSIGGVNRRVESGAVFPHTNTFSHADLNNAIFVVAAGTDIWTPTVLSSDGVVAGGSPYLTIKYAGPPLVND